MLFVCLPAWGEVSLSSGYNVSFDTVNTYELKAGSRVFAFGGYTDPKLLIVGQTMGDMELVSYGIGIDYPIADRWHVQLAVGRYEPDVDPDPNVRREVVRTTLQNAHGTPRFDPTHFTYDIDPAYGVLFTIERRFKHGFVYGRYRALQLPEKFAMWDERIGRHEIGVEPDCNCWWEHADNVDANGFEIGAGVRF